MYKKINIVYLLLLYTICLTIIGCNKNMGKEQDQQPQNIQKKEIPKVLSNMENSTEELIQNLWYNSQFLKSDKSNIGETENININREDGQQDNKDTEKKEGQNDPDNSKKEGNQGISNDNSAQKKQQDKSKDGEHGKKITEWKKIKENIGELHVEWNTYEPQSLKDGAIPEVIQSFKRQLNMLSEAAEREDLDKTLQEANVLYSYYAHFFDLYRHHAPPEIKRLKALTRQIMLNAQKEYWQDTEVLVEQIKVTWHTAKSRMGNADIALNEQIDCAIIDLESVAKEQNSLLTSLKGDILLQNLDKIK